RLGLLLFGVCWLGESFSNGYFFFYFSVIVGLTMLWFTVWRSRQGLLRLALALLTWMIAVACIAPMLLTYARLQREKQLGRGLDEMIRCSADLLDFFIPTWDNVDNRPERAVTFGVVPTVLLVTAIVVVLRRNGADRRTLGFYTMATIVTMVLALGPI